MRTLIVLLLLTLAFPAFSRVKFDTQTSSNSLNEVCVEGVVYYIINETDVECKVDPSRKKTLTQLSILPRVNIRQKNYVVRRIADKGFADCDKLVSVTIPSTITNVGELAFRDNKKLRSVTILSKKIAFAVSDFKWSKGCGPFYGCDKIETVKWTGNTTPSMAFEAFSGNESPYADWLAKEAERIIVAEVNKQSANDMTSGEEIPTFADYAAEKVSDVYNKWVKKKPYETVAQYSQRTAADQCEARKRELFENARNEYINLYAPPVAEGTIADYDSDYKVFVINLLGGKQVFAQVPLSDKTFFEDNFAGMTIKPTYNIVNNELTIVDCRFEIGDRTYISPEIFDGVADDFSSIDFEARKLDLDELLAEETEQNRAVAEAKNKKSAKSNALKAVNNAPTTGYNNRSTYALVIGNENYKYNDPVEFAISDAVTFARYCRNTLGIPTDNILAVQDVTKGELRRTMREVHALLEDEGTEKNLIVYYAGHGIPHQNGIDSYILPVDASATDIESCYSLQEFYNQLGEMPAKSVVVYLDACFTGSSRSGSQLVAARAGVSFERSQVEPRGNTVVFAATSANETAQPYPEAGHGIFTYYLLDKLQKTKGEISLGELSKYLTTKVKSQSISKGRKRQVPSMLVSPTFEGDWHTLPVSLMKK